jgi:hypothetical protein
MREQQRVGLGVSEVVDRDKIEIMVGALKDSAGDKTADAAKAIDGNFGGHERFSCLSV